MSDGTLTDSQLIKSFMPTIPEYSDVWDAFWATVYDIVPLRIILDGEDEPINATPATTVELNIGDRCWCIMVGNQLVVLGTDPPADSGLDRTIYIADESDADSVSDNGEDIHLPISVDIGTPVSSDAQLTAQRWPIRDAVQTVADNINSLFTKVFQAISDIKFIKPRVTAREIVVGDDLNNLIAPFVYRCTDPAALPTIINSPTTSFPFLLTVFSDEVDLVRQIVTFSDTDNNKFMYRRTFDNAAWSDWSQIGNDYIIETGVDTGWNFRRWKSGRVELEMNYSPGTSGVSTLVATALYTTNPNPLAMLDLPSFVNNIIACQVNAYTSGYTAAQLLPDVPTNRVHLRVWQTVSNTSTAHRFHLFVVAQYGGGS